MSPCWWSWKTTKFARLACNVKAISRQRFCRARCVWNNKGESRSARSHRCTARPLRSCAPPPFVSVRRVARQKPLSLWSSRYFWLYCCHTTMQHNHGVDQMSGREPTMENDCWDQAGRRTPDVSGLNVAFFSSLESSLMSPRPSPSSDIHFNQSDSPADRNLPPTYPG